MQQHSLSFEFIPVCMETLPNSYPHKLPKGDYRYPFSRESEKVDSVQLTQSIIWTCSLLEGEN